MVPFTQGLSLLLHRPTNFKRRIPFSKSVPCEFIKKYIQKNQQITTLRYLNKSRLVQLKTYQHHYPTSLWLPHVGQNR
ncbi:hypothetical protein EUGRSUZ_G00729 [Eucalyptus grandis]|uniref:Uncharacterized protein n=4 Tax=Eucalyptus grandis TaxID=71139 RepID=A0A059BBR3_EUCGR|nr:hypothetical protein EUGRSUZ_G00729 [Eucalyptus grandis]KAK3419957.1 hypothetical protein EUGRSUZ_G00729 [Eucalyptus grandis]KAK3419958.1 hypothetical protein EUGRSUZ_G00729 [Eucalyptus grandis]